jgi:Family of unknown function (DUF5808)
MISIDRIAKIGAIALVVGAVVKELKTPAESRGWNGKLAGVVPYDFRIPTLQRVQDRWWNPDLGQVFTPHVFGVGWAINVGRIARMAGLA